MVDMVSWSFCALGLLLKSQISSTLQQLSPGTKCKPGGI